MQFRCDIFPEKQLIVKRYTGTMSIQDFITCSEHMWAHPHYCKSYDGIADLTRTHLKISPMDLPGLASHLLNHEKTSEGRWVALASTPFITALAYLYQKAVGEKHRIEVFSTWEAAFAFLGVEMALSHLPDFG